MTNRYLLSVTINTKKQYRRTFATYEEMKAYIKERECFFVHADYQTYDLAIQLGKRA